MLPGRRLTSMPAAVLVKAHPVKCQDDLMIAVTPNLARSRAARASLAVCKAMLELSLRPSGVGEYLLHNLPRFKLALGSIHDRLAVAEQQRIEQRRCRRRRGAIGGRRPVANG